MKGKRKLIVTSGLCIALVLGNCLAASANAQNETVTVEYAEYDDIQESFLSDSGETVVLTYAEKTGDTWQAVYQDADATGDSHDLGAAPHAVETIEKTVVNTYPSFDDVPTSIYYREYTLDAWFSGYLSLQKVEKKDNFWYATYSGNLVENM